MVNIAVAGQNNPLFMYKIILMFYLIEPTNLVPFLFSCLKQKLNYKRRFLSFLLCLNIHKIPFVVSSIPDRPWHTIMFFFLDEKLDSYPWILLNRSRYI